MGTSQTCLGYVSCPGTRHFGHHRNLLQIHVLLGDVTLWGPRKLVSDMCFAQRLDTLGTSGACLRCVFCLKLHTYTSAARLGYVLAQRLDSLDTSQISDMCLPAVDETLWAPQKLVSDMCFALGLDMLSTSGTFLRCVICPGIRNLGHLRNLSPICVLPRQYTLGTSETFLRYVLCLRIKHFGHLRTCLG